MRFFLVMFSILFALTSCAGMQQYSTGIPASASHKFYFHVEQEAAERGLQVTRSEPRELASGKMSSESLNINLDDGWLQYSDVNGEIALTVNVKGAKKLTEEELASKQASLKQLSDDLVEKARARSEAANVFD